MDAYRDGLVIARIERMASSRNGNPCYFVVFTDGTAIKTAVDANVAYHIGNSEYQGMPLRVRFDDRGIVGVKRLDT